MVAGTVREGVGSICRGGTWYAGKGLAGVPFMIRVRATVRLQIRLCDRFVLGLNPKTISHTNDRNELSSCG